MTITTPTVGADSEYGAGDAAPTHTAGDAPGAEGIHGSVMNARGPTSGFR
jgi:hypothetical protein